MARVSGVQAEIAGQQVVVREVAPHDRDELVRLHVEVFGPGAGDAWHDWKYGQGRGLGIGVWHEGRLIAHCGGLPRTLWFGGRARAAVQIGDVMVHPQWRGVLTRRGPFFHASAAFYETHVGPGAFDLAFGFPNERHLRLGERTGLVWDAGVVHSLEWDCGAAPPQRPGFGWRAATLAWDAPGFDDTIDKCWQAMHAAQGDLVLGQRDAAYVRWRYPQRPGQHYQAIALRRWWSAEPVGVAIVDLDAAPARWLDWIGPPALLPTALRACLAHAHRGGATRLSLWATPAVRESLADSGVLHTATTAWLGVARRSLIAPEELSGLRWWLLGGDTDFL
jgi:hypothetical protein